MITAWRLVDWFRVNFHSIRLSFNWIMASYPFHSLYVHSQSMHISLTVLERDSIGHEQKYTFIMIINLLNVDLFYRVFLERINT